MAPLLALLIASLLAGQGLAEPFEKLASVPKGWNFVGTAALEQKLKLQIALRQENADAFEQAVLDMSTPSNPRYGQHLQSHDELKRMVRPSDETVASVSAWLDATGVDHVEEDAEWLTIRTNVGIANKLLDTEFGWYVSDESKPRKALRTLEYSIPGDVAQHVDMVHPTTRFASIRANHNSGMIIKGLSLADAAGNSTFDCNKVVTPQCLKTLYKIDYKPDADSGSKVAFASYLEEYARYADLDSFEKKFTPDAVGQNFTVVQFNGGLNNQNSANDSGEANLDLQYIYGLSQPLPITEYSTGGRGQLVPDLDQPDANDNENEPYLDFLQGVLKLRQDELPQVISTSYGEDEQSVPKSYALKTCDLFKQLGSRGVSVIFSSGDNGVGTACQSNDGKNTTKFQPQFPAACPWVTSVGSTQFLNETAAFFSSGGFSDLWQRPSYQDDAVKAYLHRIGDANKPYFNRHGRGFPDVATQGVNFAVYDKGELQGFQGTSCSAPTFAGIVALLNDARLRAYQPPLGFLNPLLYSCPDSLNDITLGGSTGCDGHARFSGPPNGSPVIPFASWNATTGWDPVTGLGTPNFPKLMKAAMPNRWRA